MPKDKNSWGLRRAYPRLLHVDYPGANYAYAVPVDIDGGEYYSGLYKVYEGMTEQDLCLIRYEYLCENYTVENLSP